MKTFRIGVDISKSTLDVCFFDPESVQVIDSFQVSNSIKSILKLIKKIKKLKGQSWVCFEHTGNYGLLLCCLLEKSELTYSVVSANEIKKSSGITRGKNDKIDAERIAIYAFRFKDKLERSKLPGDILLKIKNLLSYRRSLTRDQTRLKNQMKAYKLSDKIIDLSDLLSDLNNRLSGVKSSIKKINKQIKELIKNDDDLKNNYDKITSVKGIGVMIAAHVIMYTNNFTSFDDPRKFNSYCGLAPFQNRSGTITKATKTSRLRNRILKSLFFNGANSAALNDSQLKRYYNRKKAEGKHHHSIINAISCKLVYRIFAVVKRDEKYVELKF